MANPFMLRNNTLNIYSIVIVNNFYSIEYFFKLNFILKSEYRSKYIRI